MAQRPSMEEMKAKFHTDKVAYLTTRLELTSDESDKFWPIYNEFDDKRIDIQMARYSMEGKIMMNRGSLTDDEIIKFIKDINNSKLEEDQLNVKYNEKFLKILPPKKVLALYLAERGYYHYLDLKRGGNRNNFKR